jgi:hypothetical protein
MSIAPSIDQPTTDPRKPSGSRPKLDPNVRLKAIERELQRLARRKLKAHELTSLRTTALLQLRLEMAAWNGGADTDKIARLASVCRRARNDFEALIAPKAEDAFDGMAAIEAEIASHA